ncbi:lasso peptide biosynthesis PqqD family chaperone [Streptomyces sp. 4N509B]|uniref:lasso peptide biosynthesis PqqD family chaperone n=1 Tax=Streptomyces sp. 4N509B TaxID=3457413 RepID=UPI003FD1185E
MTTILRLRPDVAACDMDDDPGGGPGARARGEPGGGRASDARGSGSGPGPGTGTGTGTGGMVLLDERAGRYWQLNATAAHILRRLLAGADRDGLADELAAGHEGVTREAVAADIDALVEQLTNARLAEVVRAEE